MDAVQQAEGADTRDAVDPEAFGTAYKAARDAGLSLDDATEAARAFVEGNCGCDCEEPCQDTEVVGIDEETREWLDAPMGPVDVVNHPPHYTFGKFEVIDVIEDWDLDFCLANVVKYVARYDKKGDPVENLQKAKFYLDRRIAQLEARSQ